MIDINLGVSRHIQNPQVLRNGIRMSRAEAFMMDCALGNDPVRRQAVFAPKGICEFFMVCKSGWYGGTDLIAVGIQPEALIGLGESGFTLFCPMPREGLPYAELPKDGKYEVGQIFYWSNAKIVAMHNNVQVSPQDVLAHFPRTKEGDLLPMAGLYSIKLGALHHPNRHRYSVEGAVDEIYHLEFVAEPDFSKGDDSRLPSPMMSTEIWTPVAPERSDDWLKYKYNAAVVDVIQGQRQDVFFMSIWGGDTGTLLPISFWRRAGQAFPITLPCPQTVHTPLYNLDRAYEPVVYLTEFPNVADANSTCAIALASWFGGEANLKYADFTPLNGRKVTYLLLQAEEDENGDRAYRVMLKAFARAHQCGNRDFEALDWETQKVIPYDTILAQAVEHGYLKIEGQSMDFKQLMASTLPWAPKKPGVPLFGRVFQSGRIHLVVAERGVGKSEMMVLYSVMAIHAASFDNALFENRFGKPIRVLYIQRDMDLEADFEDRIEDAENLLRRTAPSAVAATSSNGIDFYEPEASLVEADEQCKVLKKLAELDPEGSSQWMLVIDNLKTEMPEVLNGGNIFRIQVFPWLDFLRKKGIAVSLLHHENQAGDISGPGSLQDLADYVFHLVKTDKKKVNGEADVEIVQDKKGRLKGKQQATAHWNWVTDEKQGITRFMSEYLDDDAVDTMKSPGPAGQEPQATEVSMPTPPVDESKEKPASLQLPTTLAELQAMPMDTRKTALFELWNRHKTQEAIADALGCSKSTIAGLLRECGVNTESYQEYLKVRNGYI